LKILDIPKSLSFSKFLKLLKISTKSKNSLKKPKILKFPEKFLIFQQILISKIQKFRSSKKGCLRYKLIKFSNVLSWCNDKKELLRYFSLGQPTAVVVNCQ
jgi:hypothetical protein